MTFTLNFSLHSLDRIQAQAYTAFKNGLGYKANPYPSGSMAAYAWKKEYQKQEQGALI